jgi:hypothetical protein
MEQAEKLKWIQIFEEQLLEEKVEITNNQKHVPSHPDNEKVKISIICRNFSNFQREAAAKG